MRTRLTVAILAVVIGTLVLTVAGSLFLVRRAAITTAETEITQQAQAVPQLLSTASLAVGGAHPRQVMAGLQVVGHYDFLQVIGLNPEGQFAILPSSLTPGIMDTTALLDDDTVAGNVKDLVFVAVPITLTTRQRVNLGGIPALDLPVLVATRNVQDPVNGVTYFVFVAGIVLLVGALVAAVLARRISLPIVRAVETTRRIADGDLSAKVPVNKSEYPELAELADSINAMGDSLGRSRGLERQFLMSVSHELRTPLTSIRGYADAVTDGATDDVSGALTIIGGEAQRLERLVQDLLDLARLDARQFSLHMQPTNTSSVAGSVVDAFRPQAHDLGLVLDAQIAPGTPNWVEADPDRLGQIVANLIENALKFASTRVVVGVGPAPTPGSAVGTGAGRVALWVSDDGPGIAPENVARVFERHFSSDRRAGRAVGSGLGLAIVAELAAAMGGTVEAHSPIADTGGTRMVVWFNARGTPEPEQPWSSAPPGVTS